MKVNALLEKERTLYLQSHVLITELKKLISESEIELGGSKVSKSNSQVVTELQQIQVRFARVEAKRQIESYNSSSSSQLESDKLLGLVPEDIQIPTEPLQVDSVVVELVRRFEAHLKAMADFAEYYPAESDTGLAVHKGLVSDMHQKRMALETKRNALDANSRNVDSLFISYYNLLGKTLYLLIHLLENNKLKQQAQQDQLNIKWLQSRAQAMILKLSVLQHQIAADTYTPPAVEALTEIKAQLQTRTQTVQVQLERATKQLTQYESLGQGFTQLVRQYVNITEETKDKQWTLSQLEEK